MTKLVFIIEHEKFMSKYLISIYNFNHKVAILLANNLSLLSRVLCSKHAHILGMLSKYMHEKKAFFYANVYRICHGKMRV